MGLDHGLCRRFLGFELKGTMFGVTGKEDTGRRAKKKYRVFLQECVLLDQGGRMGGKDLENEKEFGR
jgi:hypothetical protein